MRIVIRCSDEGNMKFTVYFPGYCYDPALLTENAGLAR
jgi:hypothetical protein